MRPKIIIIGCGNVAHVHMFFLNKLGYKVDAIGDRSETRGKLFCEKYAIPRHYTNISEMLTEEKPNVVHVLTPPKTHFDLVMQTLEAGSHVFVEKPLCLREEESNAIFAKADEKGLRVCVDHTRVYNPSILRARREISEGKYGRIVQMVYEYDDPGYQNKNLPGWAVNMRGGIFEDLLPHPISVLLSFTPDLEIQNVFSKKNREGGIEEIGVNLTSAVADAFIRLSLKARPLKNVLRIYCERGSVRIDLRNFYAVFMPESGLPNILARVLNTSSEIFQMGSGVFRSILGILAGRVHPYSGLDRILKKFYAGLMDWNIFPFTNQEIKRVVALTERVVLGAIGSSIGQNGKSIEGKLRLCKSNGAEYLVTGGTGFIGRVLVRKLIEEKKSVRVLSRYGMSKGTLPEEAEIVFGDMKDIDTLRNALLGVKTVFHCAAAMGGDWAEFYESTVCGTGNLLRAIRESGVEKLIYLSSLSVLNYNKLKNREKVDEKAPVEIFPGKRGFYTRAKKEAEDIVRDFAQANPRFNAVIVRPGLVYGPGSDKTLDNAGVLLGKHLFVFGLGKRYLGLNYVENLVDFLYLLGEQKFPNGKIYHIVDPNQPSISEYIKIRNKISMEKVIPFYIPIFIWKLGFHFIDFLIRLKEGRAGTLSYRFSSNCKILDYRSDLARKEVGWIPRYDLFSAIQRIHGKKID